MPLARACRFFIAALVISVNGFAIADDLKDRAAARAQALVERMKVFDTDGVAALSYTRFFEKMGIDPARSRKAMADLNEKLKSIGAIYSKFDIQATESSFSGDGQLYIIIPYSSIMEAQGRRILSEAFFIGVSEDEGKSWKFVDGISSTQQNIRMVIPSYSGAPLPPRRQRPVE
jgi:hypothetical protein